MRTAKLLLTLCLLVAGSIGFAKSAHASLVTTDFIADNEGFFIAMDSSGNAVFRSNSDKDCENDPGGGVCYLTYAQNGTFASKSDFAPTFSDDGTACTPGLPAGWIVYKASCNNDLEVFTGYFNDGGADFVNVYVGTIADPTEFAVGGGTHSIGQGNVAINSQGFVIFDDDFSDEWLGVQDPAALPATPEPSSLILLGTGALGLAGSIRRRYFTSK